MIWVVYYLDLASMARGGRVSRSRKTWTKVKLGKNGSDDSDEDYMASEDEFNYSEDEYCSSLANDETEESLGEFEEEEEKGLVKNNTRIKKAGKLNCGGGIQRKKKSSYVDSDDFSGGERRKRHKLSHKEKEDSDTIFTYVEEKEDGDTGESDEEDSDEEFTPDEFDSADDDDDEEELTLRKKVCLRGQEAMVANEKKRKKIPKALKRRNTRKKPLKGRSSRKARGKRRNTGKGRRKKSNADSDPDFVSSGSSDYNYTISEEEREQIREAGVFCRQLRNSFPTASSLKINEEEETVPPQRKQQERKGKEKVVDMKIEAGKQLQVCGVCLSEEGKRTVRGILNCCSHYFCFACIMEWSKVESRCPLCKRRFATIRKAARVDGRSDLKDAVILIPERDQVYQPSEEELRGHLYPYDNVLCSECHQGGDDALMLLCDLCDSPAHTFCVGLGREVPEGSWYCEACRPNAVLTSHNHVASNTLSVGDSSSTVRETFDLNELYVPETPSAQVTRHSNSPRYPSSRGGDIFSNIGLGAYTLLERRRIQSRIQQFLEDVRRQRSDGNDGVGSTMSGINLFGSLISRDGAIAPQQDARHVPVGTPQSVIYELGRLPDYTPRSLLRDREGVYPNLSSLGRVSGGEVSGIGHHQEVAHPFNSSIPNTEPDVKEQVQSMVKSHLKSLSSNVDLGHNNFKDIARASTHTILAAVGLEHRWNEVYPVQTRPLMCNHRFVDTFASGPTNEYPVEGQCSSCFDWFVESVVKEIMLTRAPPLPPAD